MDEAILADILDMIHRPVSSELLSHVTTQASLVIPCQPSVTNNSSSLGHSKYGPLPSLASFIGFLVKRSSVRTGTLLGSLVFFQRLQQTLSTIAKGMPCTSHRIFLATLIVTSKALHDTSPKNKHWAKYAAYFTLSEINLMEKQLLSLMNYHVSISPAELSNAYYRYKSTSTIPIVIKRPEAAAALHDADIPTYAAMYSGQPGLINDSCGSLSSVDSVATQDDQDATVNYYKTDEPPKAHCRQRNPPMIEASYNPFLRH
ncbi:uncharacterized protein EV154DRAFT_517019 [Mucor mucedo]|uniref:uncharacterized protein n=1 Tax=Mucor mucedo TaxID=29922 RepID=UPI00221EB554|nr:uncharacterized protein EV154DRAFT_517019 [Mucor mucedo]KAI7888696.1 hypothetical protein EV154DRAFT_517019 [Mucor mucedo]